MYELWHSVMETLVKQSAKRMRHKKWKHLRLHHGNPSSGQDLYKFSYLIDGVDAAVPAAWAISEHVTCWNRRWRMVKGRIHHVRAHNEQGLHLLAALRETGTPSNYYGLYIVHWPCCNQTWLQRVHGNRLPVFLTSYVLRSNPVLVQQLSI